MAGQLDPLPRRDIGIHPLAKVLVAGLKRLDLVGNIRVARGALRLKVAQPGFKFDNRFLEVQKHVVRHNKSISDCKFQVLHSARGPMEHNDQMKRSFAQCKTIGESYGLTVREDGSGGGSDGNFTAHMGIPTLDGLGPQGDGLHALHEHVVLNSLPRRATLLAGIIKDWVME